MVVMVFRRMASVTAPSKLGDLHLVHFPSHPMDPAGALPALGTPPESTGGEDKVLTIETRFLYNHEDQIVYRFSMVLGSLAPHIRQKARGQYTS